MEMKITGDQAVWYTTLVGMGFLACYIAMGY